MNTWLDKPTKSGYWWIYTIGFGENDVVWVNIDRGEYYYTGDGTPKYLAELDTKYKGIFKWLGPIEPSGLPEDIE